MRRVHKSQEVASNRSLLMLQLGKKGESGKRGLSQERGRLSQGRSRENGMGLSQERGRGRVGKTEQCVVGTREAEEHEEDEPEEGEQDVMAEEKKEESCGVELGKRNGARKKRGGRARGGLA